MNKILLPISAVFVFFLISCNEVTEKASRNDSIKIISVQPDLKTELKVGETVNFKFEVEYNLESSESGDIVLVVQGASNETIANELYVAAKGKNKEILEAEIVVPETRAIQVFTPLSTPASSSTTVVDSRSYKVIK